MRAGKRKRHTVKGVPENVFLLIPETVENVAEHLLHQLLFILRQVDLVAYGGGNTVCPGFQRLSFFRQADEHAAFILLGAGERHLLGLKRALYDEIYENAERADLPEGLTPVEQRTVRDTIEVKGAEQIGHLFSMTPYYWRTSPEDKRKLEGLETLTTEIEFDCRVYRKV